jgi:hypothetical protein
MIGNQDVGNVLIMRRRSPAHLGGARNTVPHSRPNAPLTKDVRHDRLESLYRQTVS